MVGDFREADFCGDLDLWAGFEAFLLEVFFFVTRPVLTFFVIGFLAVVFFFGGAFLVVVFLGAARLAVAVFATLASSLSATYWARAVSLYEVGPPRLLRNVSLEPL